MKENDYQEIKERLKRELKVVSFKLVDEDSIDIGEVKVHDKALPVDTIVENYNDEEAERRRQQACEQNGPTGVHYLLDIKYWKPVIENGDLGLRNGDYSIFATGETNCEYGSVYYVIYYRGIIFSNAENMNKALKKAAEHFERLS